jgi:hypothetical protein
MIELDMSQLERTAGRGYNAEKLFRAKFAADEPEMEIQFFKQIRANQMVLVRNHLNSGRTITGIQALDLFGCYRLSSIINRLRKQGMEIETTYPDNDQ